MANIRIDINGTLTDGQNVTFKAPCDCTAIDGFKVYYISDGAKVSKNFAMKDSHGNSLRGIGNLFKKGAYVHAILDTINGFAYLQNADTNSYLEDRLQNSGGGSGVGGYTIIFATEEPTEVAANTIVMVYER